MQVLSVFVPIHVHTLRIVSSHTVLWNECDLSGRTAEI